MSDLESKLPRRNVNTGGIKPEEGDCEIIYDGKVFFESFYSSSIAHDIPKDRDTIGNSVTEPESRFHYNAVENTIIRALAKLRPLPPPILVATWHEKMKRNNSRLLDIGSGTGHWIDFMIETYFVSEVVGVEITESMGKFLMDKYTKHESITVLCTDISQPELDTEPFGSAFHYITAIGVMFHIVDDARWQQSLLNLHNMLVPDGVILVGGEFGNETRNVQFHHEDNFETWREFKQTKPIIGQVRVNKRVRSLDGWQEAAISSGLVIVDLLHAENDPSLATPENNLLVLVRDDSVLAKHQISL